MSKRPVKSVDLPRRGNRRSFPEEFKREAVLMLLDGHTAPSVVERLGLSSTTCCIAGSARGSVGSARGSAGSKTPSRFASGTGRPGASSRRDAGRAATAGGLPSLSSRPKNPVAAQSAASSTN